MPSCCPSEIPEGWREEAGPAQRVGDATDSLRQRAKSTLPSPHAGNNRRHARNRWICNAKMIDTVVTAGLSSKTRVLCHVAPMATERASVRARKRTHGSFGLQADSDVTLILCADRSSALPRHSAELRVQRVSDAPRLRGSPLIRQRVLLRGGKTTSGPRGCVRLRKTIDTLTRAIVGTRATTRILPGAPDIARSSARFNISNISIFTCTSNVRLGACGPHSHVPAQ